MALYSTDDPQLFPPWSIKDLLIFLGVYLLFIQIGGLSIAVIFGLANKWLDWGLNSVEDIFFGKHLSAFVCLSVFLFYVNKELKNTAFSFIDIWQSYKARWFWILFSTIIGILLAIIAIEMRRISSGYIELPSISIPQLNWKSAFLVDLLMICFFMPVVEEILFRGLLFQSLLKNTSTVWAVILSAFIFTIYHIPQQIWVPINLASINFSFIFLIGVLSAYLFKITKSLTTSICLHCFYNAIPTLFYYFAFIIPNLSLIRG